MAASGLDRFIDAQAGVWDDVVAELSAGRKTSHWMWFVFPQLKGLGHSPMAHHYGIDDLREAAAYAAHPLLGERLREACRLLLAHSGQPIGSILGTPDDLKLRSSMTLFAEAAPDEPLFRRVLGTFYAGRADERTLALVGRGQGGR